MCHCWCGKNIQRLCVLQQFPQQQHLHQFCHYLLVLHRLICPAAACTHIHTMYARRVAPACFVQHRHRVVVGPHLHTPSLLCVVAGAGVAALLALHYRARYASVRCWSFAPPGGLMSPAAAASLSDICYSLVSAKVGGLRRRKRSVQVQESRAGVRRSGGIGPTMSPASAY